jgi:hypothetical protein
MGSECGTRCIQGAGGKSRNEKCHFEDLGVYRRLIS